MKPLPFIAILAVMSVFACKQHPQNSKRKVTAKNTKKKELQSLKPVFGYRFTITGDFDGDGKKETLTEHLMSGLDHKETNKFYENGDYDTLVALTVKKKPYCFLSCDNKKIKTLQVASQQQLLGLSYLKNEGDLDGDGGDEISYVVNWADWSSVNSCQVMTYKKGKWRTLYTFQVRDWQLPDLPQTYSQWFIGIDKLIIDTEDVAANKKIEQNLRDFKGFITKAGYRKIKVMTFTDMGDSTTRIVNLRTKK